MKKTMSEAGAMKGKASEKISGADTAKKMADTYGATDRTIRNDGQFARAVEDLKQADPTIEQRVHSGKVAKQSVVAGAKVLRPSSITQCSHASHASHLRNDRGRHG